MNRQHKSGFTHDALFYGSDEELLATAEPYLREGAEAGDAVVVSVPARSRFLLREALSGDERVDFQGLGEWYLSPALALAGYQRLCERLLAGGALHIRALGEITWGDEPAEQREWCRMESLFNRMLARYPLMGLCLYDLRVLPANVIEDAYLNHPFVYTAGVRSESNRYQDPRELMLQRPPAPRVPLENSPAAAEIADLTDLGALRREVHAVARVTDLPVDRIDDFVFAANEVATNALLHGARPVRAQLWGAPGRLLCRITDQGRGISDPFVGYERPTRDGAGERTGVGLWAARQLCDLLTWTRTEDGFTVRLLTHR